MSHAGVPGHSFQERHRDRSEKFPIPVYVDSLIQIIEPVTRDMNSLVRTLHNDIDAFTEKVQRVCSDYEITLRQRGASMSV